MSIKMKGLRSENNIQVFSWGNGRRFNAAANYMKKQFGVRIQKLTIDAGFSCPNRDGTKGIGGCHFCNNDAFNPGYCTSDKSIRQQIEEGIQFHEKRYRRATRYLAYFQAYTNTYSSLEIMKSLFEEALSYENMAGLIIGTRPDCIDEAKLEYLARLAEHYYVVIEYGIESVNNNTLKSINRGHTFEDSVEALDLTRKYGIKSGAHFIFGLPGETRQEMLDSVEIISSLPLHSVKFHQLQLVKGTRFALDYENNPSDFNLFSLGDYVDFIVRFLERMNPELVVERMAAETQPWINVKEMWDIRYDRVVQLIEKRMEELDIWQGKYFVPVDKNNIMQNG